MKCVLALLGWLQAGDSRSLFDYPLECQPHVGFELTGTHEGNRVVHSFRWPPNAFTWNREKTHVNITLIGVRVPAIKKNVNDARKRNGEEVHTRKLHMVRISGCNLKWNKNKCTAMSNEHTLLYTKRDKFRWIRRNKLLKIKRFCNLGYRIDIALKFTIRACVRRFASWNVFVPANKCQTSL